MGTIFGNTKEARRKAELSHTNFEQEIDSFTLKVSLDESLELFLSDVKDAIKEKQILLIEEEKEKEEAYLIPILLAYKNSSYFNRFIIATSTQQTRDKIVAKLQELSTMLEIELPIHVLDEENAYLCLRRLRNHCRREKKEQFISTEVLNALFPDMIRREQFQELSDDDWEKIHVKNCPITKCKKHLDCKYALTYQSLNKNGCIVIPHQILIGNERYDNNDAIYKNTDFLLIDEVENLVSNIQSYYQNSLHYEVIEKCFRRIYKLLEQYHIPMPELNRERLLQDFFTTIYQQKGNIDILSDKKIIKEAKILESTTYNAYIQMNKQIHFYPSTSDISHLCDNLYVIYQFFKDIADGQKKFHYVFTDRENKHDYKKIEIVYYPKQVTDIMKRSLNQYDCSMVLTGIGIAEEDNEYSDLCHSTGIENMHTKVYKEFTYK